MNDAEKKARLAAALRENLRKRKAQARAVGEGQAETSDNSSPGGGGEPAKPVEG